MSRYFIEVSYKGTGYAGFQVQENAQTIQGELERAMAIYFRSAVSLTGSSRTDAGVHARQNYFHFDREDVDSRCVYNLNALLPEGIAVKGIRKMVDGAHCRFDAVWREYGYYVYGEKDPFISDRAYYFPYRMDVAAMRVAAGVVMEYEDFEAFAKRRSQVKTNKCRVMESRWEECEGYLVYRVRSNRFLRGMVRGLVGTMLQVGRGRMDVDGFREVIESGDSARADFSVPGHGLCLEKVMFDEGYFG